MPRFCIRVGPMRGSDNFHWKPAMDIVLKEDPEIFGPYENNEERDAIFARYFREFGGIILEFEGRIIDYRGHPVVFSKS